MFTTFKALSFCLKLYDTVYNCSVNRPEAYSQNIEALASFYRQRIIQIGLYARGFMVWDKRLEKFFSKQGM